MTDYYDLGTHGRKVTTSSAEAQVWFDRGLVWCYAYNHDEALRCFRRASELDPRCAMAQWGSRTQPGRTTTSRGRRSTRST